MHVRPISLAAFVLVALAVAGLGHERFVTAAVAATPTPAALQYDEITRVVAPPATPPAPGSFQADYQAIAATFPAAGATPTPAPKHHGGLAGAIGNALGVPGAGGGDDPMEAARSAMEHMRLGQLKRLTYYRGWIRTDDPATGVATIEKCDQHQYITLNMPAKTYTVTSTQPPCPTNAMPMGGPMPQGQQQEQPGTVDMKISSTGSDLGPMTIDGIATTGADRNILMSMTNATGSCHNGQVSMAMTQYVSKIGMPRAYCPLPHTFGPAQMMARGGCKPTMHADVSGPMNVFESDRLVMYRRMSMGGAPSGGGEDQGGRQFGFVVEAGNVKWFSGQPAEALFQIPPGYTQAP